MPREPRELALIAQANRLLAEARTVHEVKDIRDRAEALRHYLKQQGECLALQNAAAELKIRAERRAGELIAERERRPPGPAPASGGGDASRDARELPPRLEDLGITYSDSSRWQRIAHLPAEVFERHIADTKGSFKELTTAEVLRLSRRTTEWEPEPETWTLYETIKRLNDAVRGIVAKCPPGHVEALAYRLRSLSDEIFEPEDIHSIG